MDQQLEKLDKLSDREVAEIESCWEEIIGPAVNRALNEIGKKLVGFVKKDGARDARRIIGARLLAFAIVESSHVFRLDEIRTMVKATIGEIANERGEL